MKKLLCLAGCILATTSHSQEAILIPQKPLVSLYWDASPDSSVKGYRVYKGPESGNYTNSYDAGNNLSVVISNLENASDHHFSATAYDHEGVESPFSNEVKIKTGPAPSVIYTNIDGIGFYRLTQTRYTNDNIFRMMQSETTNNWKKVSGAQKIDETILGSNSYYTTWLIPCSQPIVPRIYFKDEGLISIENPGYLNSPTNLRLSF